MATIVGGALTHISSQLTETRYAFEQARELAVLAIRNRIQYLDGASITANANAVGTVNSVKWVNTQFIAVGDSREQIPATTVEKIETGWADLVQVETALADALEQNPNDPFLNKRLLELRARQLGFLRQLAMLDHSNRRLTI